MSSDCYVCDCKDNGCTSNTKQYSTQNTYKAGRLPLCRRKWEDITHDKYVLDMIEGIPIELCELPRHRFGSGSHIAPKGELDALRKEVSNLLCMDVIETASPSGRSFLSGIFLRNKKDGTNRVILNLKRLNELVVSRHF